jgi:hypothetical protein
MTFSRTQRSVGGFDSLRLVDQGLKSRAKGAYALCLEFEHSDIRLDFLSRPAVRCGAGVACFLPEARDRALVFINARNRVASARIDLADHLAK